MKHYADGGAMVLGASLPDHASTRRFIHDEHRRKYSGGDEAFEHAIEAGEIPHYWRDQHLAASVLEYFLEYANEVVRDLKRQMDGKDHSYARLVQDCESISAQNKTLAGLVEGAQSKVADLCTMLKAKDDECDAKLAQQITNFNTERNELTRSLAGALEKLQVTGGLSYEEIWNKCQEMNNMFVDAKKNFDSTKKQLSQSLDREDAARRKIKKLESKSTKRRPANGTRAK